MMRHKQSGCRAKRFERPSGAIAAFPASRMIGHQRALVEQIVALPYAHRGSHLRKALFLLRHRLGQTDIPTKTLDAEMAAFEASIYVMLAKRRIGIDGSTGRGGAA